MITNAKEAKAAGMSWLHLKWRHPDNSSQELEGAFSLKHAKDVFLVATRDELTLAPPPERFSKTEVTNCEEALEEMFKALPKSKQASFLGHFNDLSLFLQAAKSVAPDVKS